MSGFGPALFRELEAESLFDDLARVGAELDVTMSAVKAAGARTPGAILDLACGPAPHHARRLLERWPKSRLLGVELSVGFLALARRWVAGAVVRPDTTEAGWARRLGLAGGDMRRLPAAAVSFDLVGMYGNSFGYFDHDGNRGVLRELRRVLRPGGLAVVTVPSHRAIADATAERPLTWVEEAATSAGRVISTGARHYDREQCLALGRYRLENATTGERLERDDVVSAVYPFQAVDAPGDGSLSLERLAAEAGFGEARLVELDPERLSNARGLMARMDCLLLRAPA